MASEAIDALLALDDADPQDTVTLTIGGESYTGGVIEQGYAPFEPDSWGGVDGELWVYVECDNETVEARGLPSHQLDIRARETADGEWTEPSVAVWAPEVEGGMIVEDDYRTLGDIDAVEVEENDG